MRYELGVCESVWEAIGMCVHVYVCKTLVVKMVTGVTTDRGSVYLMYKTRECVNVCVCRYWHTHTLGF